MARHAPESRAAVVVSLAAYRAARAAAPRTTHPDGQRLLAWHRPGLPNVAHRRRMLRHLAAETPRRDSVHPLIER